jgi:hypothetical protein
MLAILGIHRLAAAKFRKIGCRSLVRRNVAAATIVSVLQAGSKATDRARCAYSGLRSSERDCWAACAGFNAWAG